MHISEKVKWWIRLYHLTGDESHHLTSEDGKQDGNRLWRTLKAETVAHNLYDKRDMTGGFSSRICPKMFHFKISFTLCLREKKSFSQISCLYCSSFQLFLLISYSSCNFFIKLITKRLKFAWNTQSQEFPLSIEMLSFQQFRILNNFYWECSGTADLLWVKRLHFITAA